MNDDEIELIKRAGTISREARLLGADMIDEGVTLLSVAEEVEGYMIKKGGKPAFPTNISINDAAAHFSPHSGDKQRFQRGDLVKLDVGAHVEGFIGDTAQTIEVGTKNWQNLIEASSNALEIAIQAVHNGAQIRSIGSAIERTIKMTGNLPVTNLTGHGLGKFNLHTGLSIPNYDDENTNRLVSGNAIAIEPFATNGEGEVQNWKPGNIYRIFRDRKINDPNASELFRLIKEDFGPLPFCERWCEKLDPKNADVSLKTLVRHGILFAYPILTEVKGGMVAQTEHTIVIRSDRGEVTT